MKALIKIMPALVTILAMATFSVIGCGDDSDETSTTVTGAASTTSVKSADAGATLDVAERDSGSSVALKPGATLEVTLSSNPSTGYHWVVSSIDTGSLQQVGGAEYTPDPDSEGLIGSGGTDTFRFKAISPGDATIVMDYLTPDNQPSDTTFTITTNIQG
ncbi:MAG: protease inhibitor I42 family protein [Thermoleophilia bacterium]|nr:protease inhibitor I42 family protein [Thermoleophilia bacterium]